MTGPKRVGPAGNGQEPDVYVCVCVTVGVRGEGKSGIKMPVPVYLGVVANDSTLAAEHGGLQRKALSKCCPIHAVDVEH